MFLEMHFNNLKILSWFDIIVLQSEILWLNGHGISPLIV